MKENCCFQRKRMSLLHSFLLALNIEGAKKLHWLYEMVKPLTLQPVVSSCLVSNTLNLRWIFMGAYRLKCKRMAVMTGKEEIVKVNHFKNLQLNFSAIHKSGRRLCKHQYFEFQTNKNFLNWILTVKRCFWEF